MSPAIKDLHAAFLREQRQSTGKLLNHRLFPRAELFKIDLRRGEGNPAVRRIFRLRDQLGRIEQRLGGNATAVQAYPAETLVAFHEDDLLAFVRGIKRRRVPTRAGADYHDVRLNRFHLKVLPPAPGNSRTRRPGPQ